MKKKTRTKMTIALAVFMVIVLVVGLLPSLIF